MSKLSYFLCLLASLITLSLNIAVIADDLVAPGSGSGVPTSFSEGEQAQIEGIIKSNHPEFIFESLSIQKFAASSRAQGGFYYQWKAQLRATQDTKLSAFIVKAGRTASVSGLYDETLAPNATITNSDLDIE